MGAKEKIADVPIYSRLSGPSLSIRPRWSRSPTPSSRVSPIHHDAV